MATIAEAVTEVQSVKAAQDAYIAKLTEFFASVLGAINRLEQKVAAGGDAQPVIDALAPIKQVLSESSSELETKKAEMEITGV